MLRGRPQHVFRLKMIPFRFLTVLCAVICTFVIFSFIWSVSSSDGPSRNIGDQFPTKSSGLFPYGISPYTASWKAWYIPDGWAESKGGAVNGGKIDEDWNLYEHLGGNGPWVPKRNSIVTNNTAPPDGCTVQQVHMLSRHAERYPTEGSAQRMTDIYTKIKSSTTKIEDELAFLNHWKMFFDHPEVQLSQLTLDGPFAGSLDAFTTGVKYRTRYNHLMPDPTKKPTSKLRLFAASGDRVQNTARYFSHGFLGVDYEQVSELVIIPEDASSGGNTLAGADSCIAYRNDETRGHDYGDSMLRKFRATYLKPVAARIKKQLLSGRHNKLELTDDEVFAMQEMCGFETIARGKSPWCDVFTTAEWEAFEYARDLMHFYRSGPGNPWGATMGSLWVNATGQLLAKSGTETGTLPDPFYLSWTHDTDVVSILSTLGLFRDGPSGKLPSGHIDFGRNWKMSTVVPMAGRLTFERLVCNVDANQNSKSVFIRLNVNDGIVAIPGCATGPGLTCPLKAFLSILDEKLTEAGNFAEQCGLPAGSPEHIDFLHQ